MKVEDGLGKWVAVAWCKNPKMNESNAKGDVQAPGYSNR